MCKRPKLPLSSDVLATFKALEHDEGLSPVGYGSPAEELLEVETGDYASYRQGSESQQDFDELLPIGLGHPAAMAKADDCAVVEPGVNSAAAVGCHPSLKRACGEHELDDRWTKPVELPDILQFVDAALRVSISNQPRRLGKGIKAKRSTQLKKLADVAPSLWAPGYLQNVSSRAVFLPTICHALANVASHSSRDNRFQSKFEKMTRYNAEDGRTMPELQEDLAARLWYLLQDGVVDGTAAQRLEPLSFHASAPAEHDQHLPELLEPQRDHQLASDTSQDIILDDGWDNGWDDEWDYAWDDELEDCLERLEDSAASDACDDDRLESLVLDQRKLPNEKVWNGTAKDPDTPDLLAGRIGSQTASSEVIQPCFTWQYDLLPR
ncbi:hypothetical protein B0A50_04542 [Salinomyces thailandicus]|uniref:Uncharacterized protein n=1 Tax=Salinomyces thailandicus TaxID=706561 RepID=A0A4U0TZI9_9PEZI|nr:hypothetical protein B0A50_04542 [Salinomyces thailandica]